MTARTQNISLQVLNKPIPFQRRHKMYLNINSIFTWVEQTPHLPARTKFIASSIHQTHPMPARTQNVFLLILNKPSLCQRGNKMFLALKCQRWHNTYLNMCWPKARYRGLKMDLNMCWPNPPMPVRTQTASQHVLPNTPRLRGYNMHHNMCFRPSILQTKSQNLSQHVFI